MGKCVSEWAMIPNSVIWVGLSEKETFQQPEGDKEQAM
jgi:hypothetical protein